ncbi:AAA family ATPase [Luteitalea sp.]|uniref:ExeA family protein n=1 Tax=Luteitalea sp. TaxID=2004800 RepID=UPI0025BB8582|nr:AAA family ATPase [Luteitalea sp.]
MALPTDKSTWKTAPLYGAFYGLEEAPFDLTPDPRFVFLTARQGEVLSNLRYALAASKGFTLVLGEAGTGKTTLVRTALAGIGDTQSRYVLINNPTLGRQEFYEFLAREFDLSPDAATSKTRFLAGLQQAVETRFAAGGLTGLIVDEAQSMPHELLEEIRLLGNIETSTTKLLNIVLCGQPELADRLNETSLRQLKQRVALRCELGPLTLPETASYISGRLRIAGGAPSEIFTRDAVLAVFSGSKGIPRTINVICDNALIGGFAAQVKPVSAEIVHEVCSDFDLNTAPAALGQVAEAPAESAVVPVERLMFGSSTPRLRRRFSFFS